MKKNPENVVLESRIVWKEEKWSTVESSANLNQITSDICPLLLATLGVLLAIRRTSMV